MALALLEVKLIRVTIKEVVYMIPWAKFHLLRGVG